MEIQSWKVENPDDSLFTGEHGAKHTDVQKFNNFFTTEVNFSI